MKIQIKWSHGTQSKIRNTLKLRISQKCEVFNVGFQVSDNTEINIFERSKVFMNNSSLPAAIHKRKYKYAIFCG